MKAYFTFVTYVYRWSMSGLTPSSPRGTSVSLSTKWRYLEISRNQSRVIPSATEAYLRRGSRDQQSLRDGRWLMPINTLNLKNILNCNLRPFVVLFIAHCYLCICIAVSLSFPSGLVRKTGQRRPVVMRRCPIGEVKSSMDSQPQGRIQRGCSGCWSTPLSLPLYYSLKLQAHSHPAKPKH